MAAKLIDVFNMMFRSGYDKMNDEDKRLNFFIFNRYLSKKYPEQALLLNKKGMDGVVCMDIWHHFMKGEPYPSFFWSKGNGKEKRVIMEKEFKTLLRYFNIKSSDLDYLIKNHFDFVKEELLYLNKLQKENK